MNATSDTADMFRPPVNRAMRVLDRSFFNKIIPTSAARVIDRRQIMKCRAELGHDVLKLDRMKAVYSVQDPDGTEAKAVLLKPEIKPDGIEVLCVPMKRLVLTKFVDPSTWSPTLSNLVKAAQVAVMPYEFRIDYDYWNYRM